MPRYRNVEKVFSRDFNILQRSSARWDENWYEKGPHAVRMALSKVIEAGSVRQSSKRRPLAGLPRQGLPQRAFPRAVPTPLSKIFLDNGHLLSIVERNRKVARDGYFAKPFLGKSCG